jgi:hypothetical protein
VGSADIWKTTFKQDDFNASCQQKLTKVQSTTKLTELFAPVV